MLTKKQLTDFMEGCDDDDVIILALDSEGFLFAPLENIFVDMRFNKKTGETKLRSVDEDELQRLPGITEEDLVMPEGPDAVDCIVLNPYYEGVPYADS